MVLAPRPINSVRCLVPILVSKNGSLQFASERRVIGWETCQIGRPDQSHSHAAKFAGTKLRVRCYYAANSAGGTIPNCTSVQTQDAVKSATLTGVLCVLLTLIKIVMACGCPFQTLPNRSDLPDPYRHFLDDRQGRSGNVVRRVAGRNGIPLDRSHSCFASKRKPKTATTDDYTNGNAIAEAIS